MYGGLYERYVILSLLISYVLIMTCITYYYICLPAGTASERVDLQGDLATHRRAGNDATEGTGADGNAEARAGDPGESEGRSEAEGGGGGDGDRGTTQGGSAGR